MEDLFAHFSQSLPAATVLMLLVLLLSRAQRSAAHRHQVLLWGLLLSACLPFFHELLPKWRILPHWQATIPASSSMVPGIPLRAGHGLDWLYWLNLAWTVGIGWIAIRTAADLRRLRRQELETFDPDCPRIDAIATRCGEQTQLKREVRIAFHPEYPMPMTWGWLRPQIWLPLDADEWSDEQLECVLLHEMAHIERRDFVVELFTRIALAVYWFHPLAWAINRRMEMAKEMACDDRVLLTGKPAGDYAASLTHIGAGLQFPPAMPETAVGFLGRKPLIARALGIADPWLPRARITRTDIFQTAAPMTVCAVVIGSLGFKAAAETRLDRMQTSLVNESAPPPSLWSDFVAPAVESVRELTGNSRGQTSQPAWNVSLRGVLPSSVPIAEETVVVASRNPAASRLSSIDLLPSVIRPSEAELPQVFMQRESENRYASVLFMAGNSKRGVSVGATASATGSPDASNASGQSEGSVGGQSALGSQEASGSNDLTKKTASGNDGKYSQSFKKTGKAGELAASMKSAGGSVRVAFLVKKGVRSGALQPEESSNLNDWRAVDAQMLATARSGADAEHDRITYEISSGSQEVRFYRVATVAVTTPDTGRGLGTTGNDFSRGSRDDTRDPEQETVSDADRKGK